ncbi:MAG: hypothetical protein A2341_13195 [Deltaproteobacteria bacterium RIFOXYB12_FULL_58_9]|nr:MAG: hypothetical protein A2341_13195 [Deltaproteobacteria bacterium RIFOXYB12_FULL_58_9]
MQVLEREWQTLMDELAAATSLSPLRVRAQAEIESIVGETFKAWPGLNGDGRVAAWAKLMTTATQSSQSMLPSCVSCGECCRVSSPTLHPDDLDLVREQKLPWNRLYTLRRGEAARSVSGAAPFVLDREQVKIRENSESHHCEFLTEEQCCSVHIDRPLQCRAQACWDPAQARELIGQPRLTREDIFGEVPALLEIIRAHEARCPFPKLHVACEKVATAQGDEQMAAAVNEVVEVVAFEEVFRTEAAQRLDIPDDVLDLIFGRSFVELVRLFGFRVDKGADGSRTLVPRDAK